MVSIPLTDALMYAMEQLPFSALEELDSEWIKYNMADVVASQAVYDYYWNASGWKKVAHYINIAVSNNRIWAVPWINLFIYWETYVNTMYCKVLRLTVTDRVGIRDVLYQNVREDNTAGALSVLNITDVYATPLIMDGETSGAEIMDSIYREAERNYKTFLDLYVDLVKSVYRQACVRYYMDGTTDKVEVYHQAPLSDGYTASTVDVTESGHDDLEIAFSTAAIGTAIASNEFAKGADYDKVDQNGLSGRNKEEFAVPVMLHSSPVIPSESYRYDDANKTESDRDSPRYWGLWYIDDPESSGTDRIIRAHSYCAFRNDGIAAPSLPATMGYTLTIEQCRGAAIVDQQESGRAVTLAQQVASTFGASVDAATLQFTDFVDTFTSGYTMIPFVPMMCAIGVDVADIHRYSYASGLTYPVTWYPVKCTYSIKEARVAIEAWGTP
jgi:hypothetical protein